MDTPTSILAAFVGSVDRARAALHSLRASGYVCVPIEATEQMLADAWGEIHDEDGRASWRAMVASALARQAPDIPAP